MLKLSKLITSSTRYQSLRNMRFLRANRLNFDIDVFSCAMTHLVHLYDETLSKKGISFITLTGFRKAEQRNYNNEISKVIKIT